MSTPWHKQLNMDAETIGTPGQNLQGWNDIKWGTITDWFNLIKGTPVYFSTSTAATNVENLRTASTYKPYLPSQTFSSLIQNAEGLHFMNYETYMDFSIEIRNNQLFPVQLKVFRYVAKDSYIQDSGSVLSEFRDILTCIDKDITQLDYWSSSAETQNRANPLFKLSQLKGTKSGLMGQYYKIKKTDSIVLQPGQTIIVKHKLKMVMSYKKFKEAASKCGSTLATSSFLSGTLGGILFNTRGPLGIAAATSDTDGGFLDCTLQMAITRRNLTRLSKAHVPPTFTWSNPVDLEAGALQAAYQFGSAQKTETT